MVVLNEAVSHKAGRCEIRPARLCGPDMQGRDRVICEPGLNSARIASLHATDGLLFLPSEVDHLPQGSLVEFQPFYD
ncbi:hypothetical protein [Thalassococcus sp. S3]|uniref:hypothetical protein n=1 Tax=Thalassococcus sp. S3 TaxID=2017482 RepID=UPI0020C41D0F|nr:hypothetical protein [Thalassococcus sp. S3]